ncbi:MAG: YlbF family regulator [Lachnospiraceae bacterium]|nr:YlbF family regulator [Lachnospiraceae bacterium]
MKEAINQSKKVNELIRQSEEYNRYITAKRALYSDEELSRQLREFKMRNRDLQNIHGYDAYDAINSLVKENDNLLNNTIVNDYLRAEQKICRLMQQVYISVSDGLELEYLDE